MFISFSTTCLLICLFQKLAHASEVPYCGLQQDCDRTSVCQCYPTVTTCQFGDENPSEGRCRLTPSGIAIVVICAVIIVAIVIGLVACLNNLRKLLCCCCKRDTHIHYHSGSPSDAGLEEE